jgi:cytochrome c biogenesis protein CcdA
MSNINGNTNAKSVSITNNIYYNNREKDISNTDLVYQVFTESNVVILLWFLAIYLLIYFLVGLFRPNTQRSSVLRTFDIIAIGCVLLYLIMVFFQKSDREKESIVEDGYENLKDTMNSPISLFSIGFFILVLYTIIFIIGIPMDAAKPITVSLLEYGAWIIFLLVIIASFFKYFLGISITDMMDRFFGNLKEKGDKANKNITTSKTGVVKGNAVASSQSVQMNEVFNVGNNMYTYDDAQTICTAYGARLATYDEVEEAYDNGAEWCNYGWSENQSAYFPTQKATWQNLQKTKDRKNVCGRPGVNGGYMEDPNQRFGVNCYGKKPLPKPEDLKALKQSQLPPKSEDDIITDMKVKFWKDNSDKLLQINAYNNNKWSQY